MSHTNGERLLSTAATAEEGRSGIENKGPDPFEFIRLPNRTFSPSAHTGSAEGSLTLADVDRVLGTHLAENPEIQNWLKPPAGPSAGSDVQPLPPGYKLEQTGSVQTLTMPDGGKLTVDTSAQFDDGLWSGGWNMSDSKGQGVPVLAMTKDLPPSSGNMTDGSGISWNGNGMTISRPNGDHITFGHGQPMRVTKGQK